MIITPQAWTITKWLANVGFIFATISMLSPVVASTAIFPWAVYLLSNGVWGLDSAFQKNWAWVWLAGFFCIWDTLLILTRLIGLDFFVILQPLVNILERLP